MAEVTVKIAGTSGIVKIQLVPGFTVADVLAEAAKELKMSADVVSRLSPIVNGDSADLDDEVPDGAEVAAAPQVANG